MRSATLPTRIQERHRKTQEVLPGRLYSIIGLQKFPSPIGQLFNPIFFLNKSHILSKHRF